MRGFDAAIRTRAVTLEKQSRNGGYVGETMDKDYWRLRGWFGGRLINVVVFYVVDDGIGVVKGIRLQRVHQLEWRTNGFPDVKST